MDKKHVLEILIEGEDQPTINKRLEFTHSDPNLLFTDFFNKLLVDSPELEPHKETIRFWLSSVFTEVRVNWFKTVRYYGWLPGIKLFYRYKPDAPFWIRLFSGFSWGFKPLIRKDS